MVYRVQIQVSGLEGSSLEPRMFVGKCPKLEVNKKGQCDWTPPHMGGFLLAAFEKQFCSGVSGLTFFMLAVGSCHQFRAALLCRGSKSSQE